MWGGVIFSRPTNVELDAPLIVFGMRELRAEMVAPVHYLLAEALWARIKMRDRRRMLVVDELGLLFEDPTVRRFVVSLARRTASTTEASSSRPRTLETYSAGTRELLWPLTRRCTSSAHSGQVRLASCSKRSASANLSVPAWRRLDAASSCSPLVINDCQSASTLRPGRLPRLTSRAPRPIWARRARRPPAASGGPGAPHRGCVHIPPTTARTATSSERRFPRPRTRRVRRRAGALSASRSRSRAPPTR